MLTTISWVPKGAAKSIPSVADPPPSKEDIEVIIESGAYNIGDAHHEDVEEMDIEADKHAQEVQHASAVAQLLGKGFDDIADGLKELDMDNYDDEDEGIELFGKGIGESYYPSNELDPYLVDNEDSEEEENMAIKPEDSVIVCAGVESGVSQLKVYILEDTDQGPNLYVHHDIIISAYPLCTVWLDSLINGGAEGNFIAVGTIQPGIEIWDLDIMDEVEPRLTLGGVSGEEDDSDSTSVLGLAWNKNRNILASAHSDKLVKIWDLCTGECSITMEHHTDKVQAVAWNNHTSVLLSGSFDQTVVMKDIRKPSHSGHKWSVNADVESLTWDPHNEHSFVVSLENGVVQVFDIRTATSDPDSRQKPSFTLHAHHKPVSSVCYNPAAPNLLATGSTDKMVKLWDLSNNQPSCIASQNPRAGAVFSIAFSDDSPFVLAIGGSRGELQMWDTSSEGAVCQRFGSINSMKK